MGLNYFEKMTMIKFKKFLLIPAVLYFMFSSCAAPSSENKPATAEQEKKTRTLKPGSTSNDTLVISKAAAVFYQPDSIQREKIKAVTGDKIFESTMHEYFYQTRNSKIYLKKNRPALEIIDTHDARFLLFRKKDGSIHIEDLNLHDPSGLFLFDGVHNPALVDMMNIETVVPRYFVNNNPTE